MNKLLALLGALVLALGISGATLAADGASDNSDTILLSINGNVEVAAGDHADAVIVFSGDARISGDVGTLFVADGTASAESGASLDNLIVINGAAEIASGATISGDINQYGSSIDVADGATVTGSVRDLSGDLATFWLFIGAAAIVLWIGVAVATILVALLVAGLAARQVRLATGAISREPGKTFLVGLLAILLPPILAVVAFVTVIGIPAALGILFVVWPLTAFVGYLVAAIWIGEWLLGRGNRTRAERPYGAAAIGVLVAFLLGFIPLVTAVISIFGLGAVVLVAWRTLRGTSTTPDTTAPQPAATAQP
jgi:hypothetical protein